MDRAKKHNSDIVCYGHTHVAVHEVEGGIHIINLRSLYFSCDGRATSCSVLDVEDDKINTKIKFLEE